MKPEIRKVSPADIEALKNVLDSSNLFPSEYLDEMISPYFNIPDSGDFWFTYTQENVPVGLGYCVPEKLTDGTYNLLAIAVMKDLQGNGIGKKMMDYIEEQLRKLQKRILIVETSSEDEYALTREFYLKVGYSIAATIKDFWKDGDDKIIFYKRL